LFIASAFLLFFCNKEKIKNIFFQKKKDLLIIGLLGNVIPFNLISWSQLYVESIVASTLIGTMPLFTFLISFFYFKAPMKTRVIFGLVLGFLGMIIFLDPKNIFSYNNSFLFSGFIIFSAIFYAFSANWVKTLKDESSFELACCSITVAAFLTLPLVIALLIHRDFEINNLIANITIDSLVSATVLGVFCTGLAISVFFNLIKKKSPVFASQSNYLIPCFGFLWSYIFLDETLTTNLFIGFLLIVSGGLLVNKQ